MKKRILSAVLACAATMTFTTGAFAEDAVTTADNAPEENIILSIAGFTVDAEGNMRDDNGAITASLNDLLLVNNGVRYAWSEVEAVVAIADGDFVMCFTADASKAGTDLFIVGETETPEGYEDEDIDFSFAIEISDDETAGEDEEGEESDAPAEDADGDDESDTTVEAGTDEDEPSVQDDAAVVAEDDEDADNDADGDAPADDADDADGEGDGEDHGTLVMKGFGGKIMELFDSSKPDGGEVAIAAVEGEVNVMVYAKMKSDAVGTPINNGGSTTTNPGTGIALAVAPAGLAVAFVSVAAVMNKKKK